MHIKTAAFHSFQSQGQQGQRYRRFFFKSFLFIHSVICRAVCFESSVVAAAAARPGGRSLRACVSLCLYGRLWTWRWSPRGRLSGLSAFRSSQGLFLCAALELAGSAPTERGEMCLTYAQRTRSGRLEQQDTINDHRIRL